MSQENVEIVQRFAAHWNETSEPLWTEMDPEVVGRIRARGVQSGAVGTQQGALVFRFSDEGIVLYRSYLRRENALEAVGLQE